MARSQLLCIWCLKIGRKSKEHIVAEVLGCPPGFVLKHGEVCADCNSRLGPLDAVLAQSFDFLRVWAGIPGKKHKLPRITGRTNVRGSITPKGHMELHFNMGSHAVETKTYGMIPAVSGSQRDVLGSFELIGPVAHTKMNFTVGDHPHFSRAIHKIAFERLLKLTSWEHLLEKKFDPIRQFVMNGAGHREVLALKPQEWRYYHEFPNSVWHDEEGSPSVEFILCGIPFVVGLGPDQRMMEKIKREAFRIYGPNGWAYLPVTVNASAPSE
jgi:hypothetical protein